MGRAEQRGLVDVTENQQEDDSIAVQKTEGVCKLGFNIL
jgi:hypothetical protein